MVSQLKSKVVSSSYWLFQFQIIDQSLGFIRILILARLLAPEDFGLVGMAWLTLQIIDTFTQTGIHHYLIHRQKEVSGYLNSSWTFLLLRGVGLYIVIYLFAPFVGDFFNNGTVASIVRIVGLSILFTGFTNIGIIFFRKDLEFKKQFIYDLSGSVIDFTITIISAFILKNFWAIIIGSIAGQTTRLLMSYILASYRPQFELNFIKIKEIIRFGKWITGSNILMFLYSQGDDVLVGKVLGTTPLGLYQLAYKISNMPATQVTHIISTIMLPAYSRLQKDLHKLSKVYLETFQLTVFLSFFVGTGIILFSKEFVSIFLGTKWLPMVASMQILTIWGVLRSISATTGPVWQAIGTPKIVTKIQFIFVILLAILILPFTLMWNIVGTSSAVVIASLLPNILGMIMISRTTYCTLRQLTKEISLSLFGSFFSTLIILTLKNFISISNIYVLVIMAIIFTICYLVISFTTDKIFHHTLYTNIRNMLYSIPLVNKFVASYNKKK